MKYHLVIFGCQMNESDAERLAAVLEKNKYQKTEKIKEANLVAIVSCSVRQMAMDRVYGVIRNIKKENKKTKIIVTGCLPNKDKKKLAKDANLVFAIKDLPRLTHKILQLNNQQVKNSCDYLKIKPNYSTFPIAYVPIMTGCNNFCTYCVVPYTRGQEISRPAEEIIKEIKDLIEKKYKEIVLLGQNVNSYNSKNINFPKLLKMVNNLAGKFWLTFISSHPKDFSNELIQTMAQCNKLMSYLHLPVQAGNNDVLKKMNRHYTVSHYKDLIRKIRQRINMISISTDIIVGFPNEAKKQFSDTAKLMREIKFDMAYLAKYSPRPGTAAWHLPDNVSTQEKEKRWQTLNAILKKTGLENNKKYFNQTIEVLVTKNKGNDLFGQSKGFKNIRITSNPAAAEASTKKRLPAASNLTGQFVKAKIVKISSWGLEGVLVN